MNAEKKEFVAKQTPYSQSINNINITEQNENTRVDGIFIQISMECGFILLGAMMAAVNLFGFARLF